VYNYWKQRALRYNNLQWVNSDSFMNAIIIAGEFTKTDKVLDVGTGTGVVANILAPIVKKVIAIDSSPDMMNKINHRPKNVEYRICNARTLSFNNETFDKVVARYVFHHILQGTEQAMLECYRVLKTGGRIVFAEGVPPSDRAKQDFIDIFKLKEQRLTFTPTEMEDLLLYSGFRNTKIEDLWLRQMSIRNWLESSDLDKEKQVIIYKMHTEAPQYLKDDYNMTITKKDCLIDMRIAIVSGVK
jgi:ubiquinone/menaquinone biosynthesis C-methylase UbiE